MPAPGRVYHQLCPVHDEGAHFNYAAAQHQDLTGQVRYPNQQASSVHSRGAPFVSDVARVLGGPTVPPAPEPRNPKLGLGHRQKDIGSIGCLPASPGIGKIGWGGDNSLNDSFPGFWGRLLDPFRTILG